MRRKLAVLLVVLLTVSFLGCMATGTPKFADMTDKQKLTYMYQVYNAQHEDYMSMAARTDLTEAQKEILRTKKPILESLQLLIPLYDQSVQNGNVSVTQEQKIYDLLNKLQSE